MIFDIVQTVRKRYFNKIRIFAEKTSARFKVLNKTIQFPLLLRVSNTTHVI